MHICICWVSSKDAFLERPQNTNFNIKKKVNTKKINKRQKKKFSKKKNKQKKKIRNKKKTYFLCNASTNTLL